VVHGQGAVLHLHLHLAFGWKWLIPGSIVWIIAVATIRVIDLRGGIDRTWLLGGVGVVVVLLLVLMFIPEREPVTEVEEAGEFDAFAGGYPVPPMPDGDSVSTGLDYQGGQR
jgi:NADH-quinone oxidoreductase subunit H